MKLLLISFLLLNVLSARAQSGEEISSDTTQWYNKTHQIQEVTVRKKRQRYRRKDNPAVELMRKVIAAKDSCSPRSRDYCQYRKYQKITLSANDVRPSDLTRGPLSLIPGVADQIEPCPYNGKMILPVSVSEQVTRHVYSSSPHRKREILEAERSSGVGDLFRSGRILSDAMRDFFTDVHIMDDDIRLLQHTILSPVADRAVSFYHYFIVDTVKVGIHSCYHLYFRPANNLDFGFSGHLYVLADGTYRVRRCMLSVPVKTGINFIDALQVWQEFDEVGEGVWALVRDDMVLELSLYDFLQRGLVVRNTRLQGYYFHPIADSLFSNSRLASEREEASGRSPSYWMQVRPLDLTASEARMDSFVAGMASSRKMGWVKTGISLLVENYLETSPKSRPNYFDLGPIASMLSFNDVDGCRTRIGGKTTALLHPHLFLEGYYARGWRSRRDYYNAKFTWSLNRKAYQAESFPVRAVSVASTYDVFTPSERFLDTDKDNMFMSLKWSDLRRLTLNNRQRITLDREEEWGLRSILSFTAESQRMLQTEKWGYEVSTPDAPYQLRTSSFTFTLRYAPGEKIVETKMRRRPLNLDAPVLQLSHTVGVSGFLGGEVDYQLTELSLFRRFWLNSWGKFDVRLRAAAQWSDVPVQLLLTAPSNLSYVTTHGTFGLINDMELMMDRYAMAHFTWDLNGKLFNRIPLFNQLKWREFVGAKMLWGDMRQHPSELPAYSYPMSSSRPYVELVGGIHNIFRFFHVEYVRRLSYLDLPTATRHGIRCKFSVKF